MMKKKMHDWPKRWVELQAILDAGIDWPSFRRNMKLMRYIQTTKRDMYLMQWTRCRKEKVPLQWCEDSTAGDPEGWTRSSIFVTPSSLRAARVLHTITQRWEPLHPMRVLEIGGGFGALARTVLTYLDVESYTMIDGPPCLEIQRRYLEMTVPAAPIELISCHDVKRDGGGLSDAAFDLVINTNSFSEMDLADVVGYFSLIHHTLMPGGLFYTLNRNRLNYDGATPDVPFKDFPMDDRWDIIYRETPADAPLWLEVLATRMPQ